MLLSFVCLRDLGGGGLVKMCHYPIKPDADGRLRRAKPPSGRRGMPVAPPGSML